FRRRLNCAHHHRAKKPFDIHLYPNWHCPSNPLFARTTGVHVFGGSARQTVHCTVALCSNATVFATDLINLPHRNSTNQHAFVLYFPKHSIHCKLRLRDKFSPPIESVSIHSQLLTSLNEHHKRATSIFYC